MAQQHAEYTAVYRLRSDGDYDLFMVVSQALLDENPQYLAPQMAGDEWQLIESETLDFPDVWSV